MIEKSRMIKHLRQQQTVEKYAELHKALIQAGDRTTLSKLSRDVSPVRVHNRCALTGRPHGYLRKYGISHILFRELAYQGKTPGVHRSGWQFFEGSLTTREKITLACTETGDRNYTITKNKKIHPERMECMKYYPRLREHTLYEGAK